MATEIGLASVVDKSSYNMEETSCADVLQTYGGMRSVGGFAVNPNGLVYYNGDKYIKLEVSPLLRIIMFDGVNKRLLIGDDGED